MFYINFNNSSNTDFNLKVEHRPNVPTPQRDIRFTPIDGRYSGSLTEDMGTYGDIEISIDFSGVYQDNFFDTLRQIKKWLIGNINDNSLSFSDDDGYFYKVKKVSIDKDIERKLKVLGRFSAVFVCEPYLYEAGHVLSYTTSTQKTIYNDGYVSEPIIKVYGTGNITITLNNKNIYLTNIVDYIILDSIAQIATKGTVRMDNNVLGDYPLFLAGNNTISWTGAVSKIEITPNWRYL